MIVFTQEETEALLELLNSLTYPLQAAATAATDNDVPDSTNNAIMQLNELYDMIKLIETKLP